MPAAPVIDLSFLAARQGFIIQGDAAGDYAGRSVSSAGDVNGDGTDDLIVGAFRGDWGVFPDNNGLFVRLRAHTQTHGILVFEGCATSATTIYRVSPLDTGGQSESQCTRTG